MKVDALLYIEDGLADTDLTLAGVFVPESLRSTLVSMGAFGSVRVSASPSYDGRLLGTRDFIVRSDRDDISFWKRLFSETGADHVVLVYADSPFLDPEII